MKTKSLKKLAGILSRNEGISIIPIIALIVIMSVMGGVFTSIMGNWKMSAPTTLYSHKAFFLAETAAMTAIQDTQYRFYSKRADGSNWFNFGTSTADPYLVSSVTTGHVIEKADYWFEMPGSDDDGSSDPNDDNVDDDGDDIGTASPEPDRYTIIATGRVDMGSSTLAKRQIKILADITPSPATFIKPGVQTNGEIWGTPAGFGIVFGSSTIMYDGTFANSTTVGSDPETNIVYRPVLPAKPLDTTWPDIPSIPINSFDKYFVKTNATDQLHYHPGSFNVASPNYPTASFYYYYNSATDNMPHFTYVNGALTVDATCNANGVIWVTGNVTLTSTATMNAIIICEGNIDFGLGSASQIIGGVIQIGAGLITGNENNNAIVIDQDYYDHLNAAIPDIEVVSWNEAVSAN